MHRTTGFLQLGGMGFVHYNNTVEEQVAHVKRAKRFQPGYIVSPMILGPQDPIAKIDSLKVRAAMHMYNTMPENSQ